MSRPAQRLGSISSRVTELKKNLREAAATSKNHKQSLMGLTVLSVLLLCELSAASTLDAMVYATGQKSGASATFNMEDNIESLGEDVAISPSGRGVGGGKVRRRRSVSELSLASHDVGASAGRRGGSASSLTTSGSFAMAANRAGNDEEE